LTPSDDALDAKWFSSDKMEDKEFSRHLSKRVIEVLLQAGLSFFENDRIKDTV